MERTKLKTTELGTTGLEITRATRATAGERSACLKSDAGMPAMSSGGTMSVSTRCCTMCALKRNESLRSCSGPLSESNMTASPVMKSAR